MIAQTRTLALSLALVLLIGQYKVSRALGNEHEGKTSQQKERPKKAHGKKDARKVTPAPIYTPSPFEDAPPPEVQDALMDLPSVDPKEVEEEVARMRKEKQEEEEQKRIRDSEEQKRSKIK